MHEIASWMHLIGLAGTVRLRRGESTTITRRWADDAPSPSPIDWPIERDLVFSARAAMEARVGRPLATEIEIIKRVPVGGGLGGGSSEAASALLGLNDLHGLGLGASELHAIGEQIGSDLAFFLPAEEHHAAPTAAFVSGYGERVERVEPSRADVVLVLPSFGCPTGEVYRAFDARAGDHPFASDLVRLMAGTDPLGCELFNDLSAPALGVRPELAELLVAAERAGGQRFHVTGSGSTLFALCTPGHGPALAVRLTEAIKRANVIAASLSPIHPPARHSG